MNTDKGEGRGNRREAEGAEKGSRGANPETPRKRRSEILRRAQDDDPHRFVGDAACGEKGGGRGKHGNAEGAAGVSGRRCLGLRRFLGGGCLGCGRWGGLVCGWRGGGWRTTPRPRCS